MPRLTVIEPGMQTTVQDLGRPGYASLGVPIGGAADALALRAGNRLLGNGEGAAGLECTLIGPTVVFDEDVEVAVTGARPAGGHPVWQTCRVRRGELLRVGPLGGGARCYLCVAGGVLVAPLLASASTLVSAGFGGHEGRALRAGDRLELGPAGAGLSDTRMADDLRVPAAAAVHVIRATDGAHSFLLADQPDEFWTSTFTVSNQSNRVGLRLEGAAISGTDSGEMISEGAMPGAVQVPPAGRPIVLGVEHPTTGGYPIIACVASVDMHLLGQVRPGDRVRFERISITAARAAYLEREARWSTRQP